MSSVQNNIKVYLFEDLRPTPLVFIRYSQAGVAKSGIMITASHNPKEYNGLQGFTGATVHRYLPRMIENIIAEVNRVKIGFPIYNSMGMTSFIEIIGKDMDKAFHRGGQKSWSFRPRPSSVTTTSKIVLHPHTRDRDHAHPRRAQGDWLYQRYWRAGTRCDQR